MVGSIEHLLSGALSEPRRVVRPRLHTIEGWRFVPGLQGCRLCGTSTPCDHRTLYAFTEAEFSVPTARIAVHRFAYGLGWKERDFFGNLLSVLSSAKVHFMDYGTGPYDLDLTPFECERDGYEVEVQVELDNLRQWFGKTFNSLVWIDSFPELRGIGKERFMRTASILIAGFPELEAELERIANKVAFEN